MQWSDFSCFDESSFYFPLWLQQFTFPPLEREGSTSSTSWPALIIPHRFDNRCELTARCGFDSRLLDDERRRASFHGPPSLLYIFFGKVFIKE